MTKELEKSLLLYVQNIFEAVENIEEYVMGMKYEEFAQSTLTIDAVSHNVVVIGETMRSVPSSLRRARSRIPWRKFASMSDKIVHEYFNISNKWLWNAIKADLPLLKQALTIIRI